MVNKDFLKSKLGFSLFEALVVMSIVSIFVAIMASVVPHKAKPKISSEAHGGFECYYSGNNLYSRTISVGREGPAKAENKSDSYGKYCEFKPDQYVKYLIFNTVGGGSLGSSSTGGHAGEFMSAFISTPKSIYRIYPGKGGTASHPDGYPTYIKEPTNLTKSIVEVAGGKQTLSALNSKFSDIQEVYVLQAMDSTTPGYGCSYYPRAWIDQDDGRVHVVACMSSTVIQEDTYEYNHSETLEPALTGLDRYKAILQTPYNAAKPFIRQTMTSSETSVEYYDTKVFVDGARLDPLTHSCTFAKISSLNDAYCPSRYKLKFVLDFPLEDPSGAASSLTKHAAIMEFNQLNAKKPGNGGPKGGGSAGKAGAVLVSW